MTQRIVEVVAPARLHFGMFSFGQPHVRRFGGVGVTIDAPALRLRLCKAERFGVEGPLSERVAEFVREFCRRATWMPADAPCQIQVVSAGRPHVGLGSGTQMGMALARGLEALFEPPPQSLAELAGQMGRGKRSAIGVYGAVLGGLLVEAGKWEGELSPLVARAELPANWRFVLLTGRSSQGISGEDERKAFETLPPVPQEVTAALCQELLLELLPAAKMGDFEQFSASLYRFGVAAGSCFASLQGGVFANPEVASLVERLRDWGVTGVGQSSWGPTVFALVPDEAAGKRLMGQISQEMSGGAELQIEMAAPANRGAQLNVSN